ncbi:MgtC/SapB family protein [Lentibacillus sp. N15]|uniref:MgtC/SapB family protein n=1 Tax=Lentibacillus songyuanensis TaxID=3136161 RepID=UPI0031B9E9A7
MLNYEFLIRIVLAGLLGSAIGLEREKRFKEAGLRTHFLVAVGSAIIMIISKYAFSDILTESEIVLDPSRIAAQVVSGVGFLGAGMILVQRQSIHGLTTAAGIWATSAIGMAIGGGMYEIGIFGTLLVLIGLESLKRIFQFAIPEASNLSIESETKENVQMITDKLIERNITVIEFDVKPRYAEDEKWYTIRFKIEQKKKIDKGELTKLLQDINGVIGVKWS